MIFSSPYPDLTIPNVPLTDFVLRYADRLTDKPALVDGSTGRSLTYGELASGIRRAAVGLTDYGFRKGDVFATICPSCLEFALVFYGVASLGGATTMLNPLFTAGELASQLADSNARFILTVPERLDVVREAATGTSVEAIFVIGEGDGATPFASLLSRDGTVPAVAIDPETDVVVLPYSSGTTGRPKGVMLTHRNLIASALAWPAVDPVADDEVVVTIYPCFHIAGVVGLNVFLSSGATFVTMARYDLRGLLGLLQDRRASRTTLSPPVILDLTKQSLVDDYDLSRLRIINWGAAPMSEQIAQVCRERFHCQVKQMYGMTEAVPTHVTPTSGEDRPGSGGPVTPNTRCKVIDILTGDELGPGESGEICVRGPAGHEGVSQPAGGDRADDRRRGLAAHRRHRLRRRGRLTSTSSTGSRS